MGNGESSAEPLPRGPVAGLFDRQRVTLLRKGLRAWPGAWGRKTCPASTEWSQEVALESGRRHARPEQGFTNLSGSRNPGRQGWGAGSAIRGGAQALPSTSARAKLVTPRDETLSSLRLPH